MRYNDGFWLLKHNVKAYYALQTVKTAVDNDGIDLQVSTRPIRHRGDTLGGPVLSVRIHSPAENIIGVRLDHFKHIEPFPSIELFPDGKPAFKPTISQDTSNGTATLVSGALTASLTSQPYTITFSSPKRTLTFAGPKHQAIYDVPHQWTLNSASSSSCLAQDPSSNPSPIPSPSTKRYIHSELNLSPGELVYGLGEQFGPFVKNGQEVAIWNRDGGTSSEQAYKCVPFYLTNRGYGVFVNHFGEVDVEVGSEKVSRVGISVADSSLEWFLIYGETPLQILERYTLLTGRPALLPAWTYGLWLSTSFLTDYSSKTVSSFLEGMQTRSCDVRVFHFDCFWMKQYEWCSFTFDPDNFPDPKAYIAEIKKKYNVKVCVWINPYISQLSPIFEEGVKGGFFIKRADGTPWQWDLWQPGLAVLDVTNPAACDWYTNKLSTLMDLGVDAFKTDFGERIPHANVKFSDGSDPMRMHNAYAIKYNQLVFNLLEKRYGKSQAVLFARTSAAGGQRFPVHWGGDCESTWEAMAEAMRGCLSLTSSGFAYASHDIGGFEGHPPPEIYMRWVAFGLFSSHSRLHGSDSYRVPWNYGEDAAKALAKFLDAKHRLMPYIYNLSIEASTTGAPLMRTMFLEFPNDRNTHILDRQFMLGPSLLVAPVFTPSSEKHAYYLPPGTWTSFADSSRSPIVGPQWIEEDVALDDIPIWIREGSVLPLGPSGMRRPDYEYAKVGLEFRIAHLVDGASVEVHVPSGHLDKIAGLVRVSRSVDDVNISVVNGEVTLRNAAAVAEGKKGESTVIGEHVREFTVRLQ